MMLPVYINIYTHMHSGVYAYLVASSCCSFTITLPTQLQATMLSSPVLMAKESLTFKKLAY